MDDELKKQLAAQFATLPPVVQNAITSADVEKELRSLATSHKLHIDQWQILENEVLMALFGIQPIVNLQKNLEHEVGMEPGAAQALAEDIMRIVFEPIREELERELGHPEAKEETLSDVEHVRDQMLAQNQVRSSNFQISENENASSTGPAIQLGQQAAPIALLPKPGTPPPLPPTEKVIRMPASGAYKPGETSVARADIADDPYRESPK